MEQEEIWKDVVGYEGLYQVSNLGRVKSVERTLNNGYKWQEKILKLTKKPRGYLRVHLCKNGTCRDEFVHRLVAIAFIPNDDIFATTVNHKNEDKTDNRVENLEWLSLGDNLRYSNAGPNGNRFGGKHHRAKQVRCIETGEVFDCAADVARLLGLHSVSSSIRNCCRAGGYHWEYVEKDKQNNNDKVRGGC